MSKAPQLRKTIKYAPAAPRKVKARTVQPGKPHAHSCSKCRDWYEDSCETPTDSGTCLPCRTGHAPPMWAVSRRPRDCCVPHSRVARKEELERYKLGGPGPWFICVVCWRSFGYNPAGN